MLGRILIVDDDPDMRLVLREHLEPEGFEVLDAGNGAEMRALIEQEEVDLVILDLQLPDEDGLNLAKVLREKTDAGIVMLTGKGTSVDMVVGLEVGADDYVAKPFKARELLARIRSVLRRTKQARSAKPGTGGAVVRFDGWRLSTFDRPTGQRYGFDGGRIEIAANLDRQFGSNRGAGNPAPRGAGLRYAEQQPQY